MTEKHMKNRNMVDDAFSVKKSKGNGTDLPEAREWWRGINKSHLQPKPNCESACGTFSSSLPALPYHCL